MMTTYLTGCGGGTVVQAASQRTQLRLTCFSVERVSSAWTLWFSDGPGCIVMHSVTATCFSSERFTSAWRLGDAPECAWSRLRASEPIALEREGSNFMSIRPNTDTCFSASRVSSPRRHWQILHNSSMQARQIGPAIMISSLWDCDSFFHDCRNGGGKAHS